MRIAIVGGNGFLGSRAAAAIRKLPNVVVEIAGRAGPLGVDLKDPATFESLRCCDVVVDFAGTLACSPEALARFCIREGIVMFEASAERPLIEALHAALRDAEGPGSLVLGAGIFTGMSNLLAGEAVRALPGCTGVRLGIASHPYSGAGQATVDLMAAALDVEYLAYSGGAARRGPPCAPGPVLPFPRGAQRSLAMPLAEQSMLPHSLGVGYVEVFLSPRPTILQSLFCAIPIVLLRSRVFRWCMRTMFGVLRGRLLKRRVSPVEMVCVARAFGGEHVLTLDTDDGMTAAGAAVAGLVAQLQRGIRPTRALCFVDDVFELRPTLEAANALCPPGAAMRLE